MPLALSIPDLPKIPASPLGQVGEGGSLLASLSQLLAAATSSCSTGQGATIANKTLDEVPVGCRLPAHSSICQLLVPSSEYVYLATRLSGTKGSIKECICSWCIELIRPRVTSALATWVLCLAIYASVVTTKFAKRIPATKGYTVDTIRASRQFRWLSWVLYDVNYCRQAAASNQTDWSKINPNLYVQCFTGWARNTGGVTHA